MKSSEACAAEFWIVVARVNLASDEPSQGAADNDVAGKMFFAGDSGYAYAGGQAVSQQFGQRAGIFMSQDAGDGPSHDGVTGGKRGVQGVATSESPLARVVGWKLAASGEFENFVNQHGVNCGLSRQNAGFALMIIAVPTAQEIKSATSAEDRCESRIRKCRRALCQRAGV